MKLRIKIQVEAGKILRDMADEAGLSVNDMGEILIYAGIGGYMRDKIPSVPIVTDPTRLSGDVNRKLVDV